MNFHIGYFFTTNSFAAALGCGFSHCIKIWTFQRKQLRFLEQLIQQL